MGIFSKFGQKTGDEAPEGRRQRVDEMIAIGKTKEGPLKLEEMEATQKVKSAFKEKEEEPGQSAPEDQTNSEGSEKSEKSKDTDNSEKSEISDASEKSEKSESSENSDGSESSEDSESLENSELSEDSEDPEVVGHEERMSLAGKFIEAAAKILFGEATPEDFLDLADMIAAREAVEAAFAEGELKGRNAQIEERLVVPPVGVPDLGGAPVNTSRRPGNSIFDLAGLAR